MKNSNWRDAAELVGILAIVLSLVFVGLQLQQSQKIAMTDLSASIHESRVATNSAISDHSETWVKGNAGGDLSPSEEASYLAMLHSFHWRHVIGFNQRREFGQTQVMDSIVVDFAIFLDDNPGARERWPKILTYDDPRRRILGFEAHPNNFVRAVREALERLDATALDQ